MAPAIFGTLFERSLDPKRRSLIGAHYTSEEDIRTLLEPVLMRPLENRWEEVKTQVLAQLEAERTEEMSHGSKRVRLRVARKSEKLFSDWVEELTSIRVLDPACGSGNFLYLSLRRMLDLWLTARNFAAEQRISLVVPRMVSPSQLHGIETEFYAHELASIVVWIGFLQWKHEHGVLEDREPILEKLTNIEHGNAVLRYDAEGNPYEPQWPKADFIIGNPPFLGDKKMRGELGDVYVDIGQLIRRTQTVEFENRLFLMSGAEQPSSGDGTDPRCQPGHADRTSQALELGQNQVHFLSEFQGMDHRVDQGLESQRVYVDDALVKLSAHVDRGGRLLANPDHVWSQGRSRDRFSAIGISCGYGVRNSIANMPPIRTRKRALAALPISFGATAGTRTEQVGFPHHTVPAILCLEKMLLLPHAEHRGQIIGMKVFHLFCVAQFQSTEGASGEGCPILADQPFARRYHHREKLALIASVFSTFEARQLFVGNGCTPHLAHLDERITAAILDKGSDHLHQDHLLGPILCMSAYLMPLSLTISKEHEPLMMFVTPQDLLCNL